MWCLCSQIFEEFLKFGEIEEIAVCENLGDHMIGNVYVKYAPIYLFFCRVMYPNHWRGRYVLFSFVVCRLIAY